MKPRLMRVILSRACKYFLVAEEIFAPHRAIADEFSTADHSDRSLPATFFIGLHWNEEPWMDWDDNPYDQARRARDWARHMRGQRIFFFCW